MNVFIAVISRQHDESQLRVLLSDDAYGVQSAHARQSQVHQHDVRRVSLADGARFFTRTCFGYDNHVRLKRDDCREPKAYDRMIIDEDDTNHRRIRHSVLRILPEVISRSKFAHPAAPTLSLDVDFVPGRNLLAELNDPAFVSSYGDNRRSNALPAAVESRDDDATRAGQIAKNESSGDRLDQRRRSAPLLRRGTLFVPFHPAVDGARTGSQQQPAGPRDWLRVEGRKHDRGKSVCNLAGKMAKLACVCVQETDLCLRSIGVDSNDARILRSHVPRELSGVRDYRIGFGQLDLLG